MRLVFLPATCLALGLALGACVPEPPFPARAEGPRDTGGSVEAYCTGGVAGLSDRVRGENGGTIRATRRAAADETWPVVAEDPSLVVSWLAKAASAPTAAPPPATAPHPDALGCGVILTTPTGSRHVEAPELHREMMTYLPPR